MRVANRGRSIPQSQRRYVFEPFFRGREGAVGAGLGLAICRGFVEANGGQIALQSAREGATTFAVSFPLTTPAQHVAWALTARACSSSTTSRKSFAA